MNKLKCLTLIMHDSEFLLHLLKMAYASHTELVDYFACLYVLLFFAKLYLNNSVSPQSMTINLLEWQPRQSVVDLEQS